jgi:hypothetical protein
MEQASKIRTHSEVYIPARRDWVERGSRSRYALPPDEVVRRSRPRSAEIARAAACFELAQHLYRDGHHDAAVRWFRQAHRLQPDSWTYHRQTWFFADPLCAGPAEGAEGECPYDGDWLTDTRKVGTENYYPPPEL